MKAALELELSTSKSWNVQFKTIYRVTSFKSLSCWWKAICWAIVPCLITFWSQSDCNNSLCMLSYAWTKLVLHPNVLGLSSCVTVLSQFLCTLTVPLGMRKNYKGRLLINPLQEVEWSSEGFQGFSATHVGQTRHNISCPWLNHSWDRVQEC